MHNCLQSLLRIIQDKNINSVWVALSGGIDSCSLLHFISQSTTINVKAIYVEHNLQDASKNWAKFCEGFCKSLKVDLVVKSVKVCSGNSVENQARIARYEAFSSTLAKSDLLLTAHHLDDQAETYLLRAFRGSGVNGLSAIPRFREHAHFYIFRPFLTISKEQIISYARKFQISFITDPTNCNIRFKRNFIREEIIPLLETQYASISSVLARNAEIAAEENAILQEITQQDFDHVLINDPYLLGVYCLDSVKLHNLSRNRIHCVLRLFLSKFNELPPDSKHLQGFWDLVNACNAKAIWKLKNHFLMKFKNKYFIMNSCILNEPESLNLPLQNGTLKLANNGFLTVENLPEDCAYFLKYRARGMQFFNGIHHKSLKKALNDLSIPYILRNRIPLLVNSDGIVIEVASYGCLKKEAENNKKPKIIWNPPKFY